jgi:hypothetical protein
MGCIFQKESLENIAMMESFAVISDKDQQFANGIRGRNYGAGEPADAFTGSVLASSHPSRHYSGNR